MTMKTKTTAFSAQSLLIIAVLALSACSGEETVTPESLFKKKCGTCHSIEPGAHKIGPSLGGILGRKAGSTDFTKYKALKDADFVWDEEKLDAWIKDPKAYIGKPTAMTVKVKIEDERKMIINFLKNHKE
jgi:cytochrome c